MKPPIPVPAPVPKPSYTTAAALRAGAPAPPPNPQFAREADAARRHAAEFAPNVVGGVAKEAAGIMDIAIHQVGGPKPYVPSHQKPIPQAPAPIPPAPQVRAQPLPTPPPPPQIKQESEHERIVRERREGLAKLREEQITQSLDRPRFRR